MKKHFIRALALTTAAVMACGSFGAAAAGVQKAEKKETVYATLAPDGSVQKLTDSVWLHSEAGLKQYEDKTELSDIAMLKGTEDPVQTGDTLMFDTADTDAWYQGSSKKELPVGVKITYTLDGKQMPQAELAGKSGHLVMHLAFENRTGKMQMLGGKLRRIPTPFLVVAAATLDTDIFTNVSCKNALLQSDSAKELVGAICLPGVAESYSGLLTGKLAELAQYLYDDVTIEADVTGFEMPMLYLAAATDASALADESGLADYGALFDDLSKLSDAMKQLIAGGQSLTDGSAKLADGASTLSDGLYTLQTGANELSDKSAALNAGAVKLQNGAHQAAAGAGKAAAGAFELIGGLRELCQNNAALKKGSSDLADAILASANDALKQKGVITDDMTFGNYADVLGAILDVTDEMRAQARATVVQQAGGLTDAETGALLYLTAVAGDHNFTAAGNKMKAVAADTAANGVIYNAKAALTQAGANPLAIAQLAAMVDGESWSGIMQTLTAGGAAEEQAALMIVIAAMNATGDLSADLANASALLSAAGKTQAAAAALAQAGGNGAAVSAVQPVLQQMVAAGNGQLADEQAAYDQLAASVNAGENTALIITLAAMNKTDDFSADLAAAANTAALAQNGQAKIGAAQSAVATAGGAVKVPEVQMLLAAMRQTTYGQLAAATGLSDAQTQALLLTMAAQAMAQDAKLPTAAAMIAAGKTLTRANEVNQAFVASADLQNTEAQQMIKALLTDLVKTEKKDDLAQISELNGKLAAVQGYVIKVGLYADGVQSALSGAQELESGLTGLVGGINTLSGGTDDLAAGTGLLLEGVARLKKGADDLASGGKTLKDGAVTLHSGTGEMLNGLNRLNDEGISRLTDSSDLADLQTVLDVTSALKTASEQNASFAGASQNAKSSVKFIMKVAEETDHTDSRPTGQMAAGKTNTVSGIWNRFLALFESK